ncbi:39S ribosomal protein L10, mitochondrial-like [Penaeus chinensis]|uniref:39S ribosomal protein L10, mitochondrial-like n=1 Tax=Penaeus chinensis TaxID=139456 RepID=UPI001FB6BC29|nr:39S ribosomal protein L10, mitochondrial-like [Penaeus chinensis]XP_047496083.1 39S ribosomal protein L10, mitochondrial-like [Penaeus chinensis]
MALVVGRCLLGSQSPLVQTLRFRTRKPNLRKPAIPHWDRALVLKVTEPFYPAKSSQEHPANNCNKKRSALQNDDKKVNPFEQILAQEFLEKIRNAKVVAIFHRNPMSAEDIFTMRLQLHKIKLEYLHYNNSIARLAFSGSEFDALLKLYESDTLTVVGEASVAKLLKLEKKLVGLVLLAGVVEGRLMSVADMKRYAALPSLDGARGQLLSILSAPAQKLSQNMTSHQRELSSALGRYISDQTPTPQAEEQ